MPSRSLLSVQEKLERRWKYVQEAEWMAIGQAMAHYYAFVSADPALSMALRALRHNSPSEPWLEQAIDPSVDPPKPLYASDSREEAASRGWALLSWAVRADMVHNRPHGNGAFAKLLGAIGSEPPAKDPRPFNDYRRDFLVSTYLRPLHEYLLDALDANVETLAAIRWFQQWAQWFGASRFAWEQRLEDDAVKDGKKKIHEYEKRFQPVLFEKLFEYGLRLDIEINREPSTASGEPDFVVTQQTAAGPGAIPVEAKIVDSRCDASTRFGFRQLRRYMDERHADAGYLVLFDTTPHGHQVDLADAPDGVPFIPLADQRRVYVVYVPTCQQLSASLDRKAAPARPGLTRAHFDERAD